jgi:uncharacterized cupin superfamily protein
VRAVNVTSCDLDEVLERGEFRHATFELTERLGASVIGATVYEMQTAEKCWPYHYHHGVEEWLYVVCGAPVLRDRSGQRTLAPGELVAFQSGPLGAHTVHGPGRILMFSTGARGWGEAFVTVYLDSDKIGAAPGVMFRRADAIDAWRRQDGESPVIAVPVPQSESGSPTVNLMTITAEAFPNDEPRDASRARRAHLGRLLATQTWTATLYELAPREATAAYHHQWCREEWALVLDGAPTLRHAGGRDVLHPGDILCFPEGPTGAHQLLNDSQEAVRLIIFSTPTDRPMSAFFPDDRTVLVRVSDHEGFLFRQDDQIEDYWDGEPGAGAAKPRPIR